MNIRAMMVAEFKRMRLTAMEEVTAIDKMIAHIEGNGAVKVPAKRGRKPKASGEQSEGRTPRLLTQAQVEGYKKRKANKEKGIGSAGASLAMAAGE